MPGLEVEECDFEGEDEDPKELLVQLTVGQIIPDEDSPEYAEVFCPSPHVEPLVRDIFKLSAQIGEMIAIEGIQRIDQVFKDGTCRRYERVGW